MTYGNEAKAIELLTEAVEKLTEVIQNLPDAYLDLKAADEMRQNRKSRPPQGGFF